MALANYAAYVDKIEHPFQHLFASKGSITVSSGRLFSLWVVASPVGAVPTTPVVPTNLTVGAIPGMQNSGGVQRLAQVQAGRGEIGGIIIADRLSHQGGLSGTVTGAQTTNLPTAALTRYANGHGVMAALEIYTALGTTATTVTVSYTNQAGTAGRVSPATAIGGTGFNEAHRFILIPLAAGDTGVRSVESVTLAATTGTAGNFGVTLLRPLMVLASPTRQPFWFDAILSLAGNMPQVLNDACLFFVTIASAAASGILLSELRMIET